MRPGRGSDEIIGRCLGTKILSTFDSEEAFDVLSDYEIVTNVAMILTSLTTDVNQSDVKDFSSKSMTIYFPDVENI